MASYKAKRVLSKEEMKTVSKIGSIMTLTSILNAISIKKTDLYNHEFFSVITFFLLLLKIISLEIISNFKN